jgi:hypothetical protein
VALLRVNAVIIGIALFYSILFLPLVPIGIVGIVVLLGLLPLAPICSLVVRLRSCRALKLAQPALTQTGGRAWPAIILGFAILVMLEVRSVVTQLGLQMAGSTHVSVKIRGIKLLRAFGSEPIMLSACYDRSGRGADILSNALALYRPISSNTAREIYYQVTGDTFNAQPRPASLVFTGFDPNQGGDVVGQRNEDLYLRDSDLEVAIEPDTLLAYLEWTIAVQNDSERLAQARFQFQLPPGAVVSRVSLWVDGEPREAAFGARGQVRSAYEKVVRARRDPILVTHNGPDSVLVQLFPVPARGGEMKFRIGITTPLDVADLGTAWIKLPEILERNFAIPESTAHSVHAESLWPLDSPTPGLVTSDPESDASAIAGDLSRSLIDATPMSIQIKRKPNSLSVWTSSGRAGPTSYITQTLEQTRAAIDHVVLVIDGSRAMAAHRQWLIDLVRQTPPSIALSIIIASDEVFAIDGHQTSRSDDLALLLADVAFVGGMDNSAALRSALEIAERHSNCAVLWLHGPQNLLFGVNTSQASLDALVSKRTPIIAVQLVSGPNRLREVFACDLNFRALPTYGDSKQAIDRLFQKKSGAAPRYTLQRTKVTGPGAIHSIASRSGNFVSSRSIVGVRIRHAALEHRRRRFQRPRTTTRHGLSASHSSDECDRAGNASTV